MGRVMPQPKLERKKMKAIEIKLALKKSTKGTYVYESPDSAVPTLYVRRDAFDGDPPEQVELHIKEVKA